MRVATTAFVLLTAACFGGVCVAEGRASTEEERQTFLKGTRLHARDPLSDLAGEFRTWALKWMAEVEDVTVKVNAGVLMSFYGKIPKDYDDKHRLAISSQFVLACGVYAIEHEKDDPLARNVLALKDSVAVYETLIKDHPERRTPVMDDLKKRADADTLAGYVKDILTPEKKDVP